MIWHILTEILPHHKRLEFSSSLVIQKSSYFPKIKQNIYQKFFCEFLFEYSKYVQTKMSCSNDLFCIFEGTVNISAYEKKILCDMKDLSYLESALGMMTKLAKAKCVLSWNDFLGAGSLCQIGWLLLYHASGESNRRKHGWPHTSWLVQNLHLLQRFDYLRGENSDQGWWRVLLESLRDVREIRSNVKKYSKNFSKVSKILPQCVDDKVQRIRGVLHA